MAKKQCLSHGEKAVLFLFLVITLVIMGLAVVSITVQHFKKNAFIETFGFEPKAQETLLPSKEFSLVEKRIQQSVDSLNYYREEAEASYSSEYQEKYEQYKGAQEKHLKILRLAKHFGYR